MPGLGQGRRCTAWPAWTATAGSPTTTCYAPLGCHAATRLDIREQGGLLLITSTTQGVFSLTRGGHLRLPATARRWCGLAAGDRVLLMAEPDDGLLVVHPPAALDAMVGWLHEAALGGNRP